MNPSLAKLVSSLQELERLLRGYAVEATVGDTSWDVVRRLCDLGSRVAKIWQWLDELKRNDPAAFSAVSTDPSGISELTHRVDLAANGLRRKARGSTSPSELDAVEAVASDAIALLRIADVSSGATGLGPATAHVPSVAAWQFNPNIVFWNAPYVADWVRSWKQFWRLTPDTQPPTSGEAASSGRAVFGYADQSLASRSSATPWPFAFLWTPLAAANWMRSSQGLFRFSPETSEPVRRTALQADPMDTKRFAQRSKETPTRYANAVLLDVRTGRRVDQRAPLKPASVVRLRLDIGKLSAESQVQRPVPFPERKLPRGVELNVMVSSSEFAISAQRDMTAAAEVAHGRFLLPSDGSSARNPDGGRFVSFYLRSPERPGVSRCRIGYYYRNVLVQSQHLVAKVGRRGGFTIETDFTSSADLTDLDAIPERPRVSVLTNSNGSGLHQIVLRSLDPTATSADGATFQVNETNVGKTIAQLRAALAERAPTQQKRRPAELAEDLRHLAQHGWTLYTLIPGQRTHMFQPLFDRPDGYVVQVLRPTTSGFVFPWSLVYEIPLNTDRPELCRLVSEWTGTDPLIQGSPRECPFGPHDADVLCPFGFWGFRYALEQLASTDKPITSISTVGSFQLAVAETQYDVDLEALAKHVDALRRTLSLRFPDAQLREGKDKKSIKALLADDLPLVYFYCHGERRNVADPDTWLGVGKQEALTAKEFIGWVVSWQRTQKKRVWNRVRPLIFVNACHSLAVYPETLISYLDAFVGTAHAAGVIGTEVKVHQRLAMDVAQRFFELILSQEHSVESALRTIRLHYLAHGNLLGLVYTPYCWADLRLTKSEVARPLR